MRPRGTCAGQPGARPRLGVLGGTFDPPHYAHLALAETARVQLGLKRVLFAPVGHPPHKSVEPMTPVGERAALVEAAVADNAGFILSRVDLDRPGPHYTVDTLRLVQAGHPAAELFLLLGGDSLAELPTWWHPSGIVAQARLAVMERPGWDVDLRRLERALPGVRDRVALLDVPGLDLSSTDLRRRVKAGLPIRYLVPPAVEQLIRDQCLYLGGGR
jgi:nicotinate-nucleotide adenylyltransferase